MHALGERAWNRWNAVGDQIGSRRDEFGPRGMPGDQERGEERPLQNLHISLTGHASGGSLQASSHYHV